MSLNFTQTGAQRRIVANNADPAVVVDQTVAIEAHTASTINSWANSVNADDADSRNETFTVNTYLISGDTKAQWITYLTGRGFLCTEVGHIMTLCLPE